MTPDPIDSSHEMLPAPAPARRTSPIIQCKDCALWNAPSDHWRDGGFMPFDCRRRAPIVIEAPRGVMETTLAVWPQTRASDGCMEGIPL